MGGGQLRQVGVGLGQSVATVGVEVGGVLLGGQVYRQRGTDGPVDWVVDSVGSVVAVGPRVATKATSTQ